MTSQTIKIILNVVVPSNVHYEVQLTQVNVETNSAATETPNPSTVQEFEEPSSENENIEQSSQSNSSVAPNNSSEARSADSSVEKATQRKSRKRRLQEESRDPIGYSTYCLCEKNLEMPMLECGNEYCLYQWYHYSCVGVTTVPLGEKWFCPVCRDGESNIMKPIDDIIKSVYLSKNKKNNKK